MKNNISYPCSLGKRRKFPRKTRWWKKFFQRKRKKRRRRSKMLCMWKDRAHVLGMPQEKERRRRSSHFRSTKREC